MRPGVFTRICLLLFKLIVCDGCVLEYLLENDFFDLIETSACDDFLDLSSPQFDAFEHIYDGAYVLKLMTEDLRDIALDVKLFTDGLDAMLLIL